MNNANSGIVAHHQREFTRAQQAFEQEGTPNHLQQLALLWELVKNKQGLTSQVVAVRALLNGRLTSNVDNQRAVWLGIHEGAGIGTARRTDCAVVLWAIELKKLQEQAKEEALKTGQKNVKLEPVYIRERLGPATERFIQDYCQLEALEPYKITSEHRKLLSFVGSWGFCRGEMRDLRKQVREDLAIYRSAGVVGRFTAWICAESPSLGRILRGSLRRVQYLPSVDLHG